MLMPIQDPSREPIRVATLREGRYYLQSSGNFVRHIDQIVGNDVLWHDRVGSGRCTKQTFIKNCIYEATPEEIKALYEARRS